MLFVNETETVDITDDGKTYHVTIRKLNEGDRIDRLNLISRRGGIDGIAGRIEEFDLVHSVEGWDFPKPLSLEAIRELEPWVADEIHTAIRLLNPSIWPEYDRPTEASTAETTTTES